MKHNNISKLTILSCLFIGTIANAQNFYTCVPKEDWFNKRFDTRMLYEKFETAKKQINNDSLWEYLEGNRTSGTLARGIYKMIVRGGDGGSSGRSQDGGNGGKGGNGDDCFRVGCGSGVPASNGDGGGAAGSIHSANGGGSGEEKRDIFLITESRSYSACFGRKGGNGGDGNGGRGGDGGAGGNVAVCYRIGGGGGGGGGGGAGTGGQGGGGAGGYFNIPGISSISVSGGNGAGSPGASGGNGGDAGKTTDSYSYDGRSTGGSTAGARGGNAGGSIVKNNFGTGCNAGGNGNIGRYGDAGCGGNGAVGYYECHAKNWGFIEPSVFQTREILNATALRGSCGDGGSVGSGGSGGRLMSSGQGSNSGDGYVYIYKYKG